MMSFESPLPAELSATVEALRRARIMRAGIVAEAPAQPGEIE
jgi:hypothetical protein